MMAEEWRFVCKLCSKKFPCGKSLGGHMRSHVVAEFEEKLDLSEQFLNESGNGYVLRENPKKTWRAARAREREEKVCKQCGKGFQSMKALCGHMACHSDKERGGAKDDHSWTTENHKLLLDTHSDTEAADDKMVRTRSSKSRRCKKVDLLGNYSSSVSEIDGQEQEIDEMAACLMMLSRDSGVKLRVMNSVVESSDNNSVVVETKSSSPEVRKDAKMEDSDSGYFLDECAKGESEVSVDWFRRSGGFGEWKRPQMSFKVTKSSADELSKSRKGNAYDDDDDGGTEESRKRKSWNESSRMVKNGGEAPKKSKYECFNCNKIFKSYQALGGHRPCHKRSNAYGECGENSPDAAAYYRTSSAKFVESSSKRKESSASEKKGSKSKKNNNKPHVCPFCDRVFKNGQALGGHKRSHFLTGHDESSSRSRVEKPHDDIHDLLDLNLPAPEADEDEGRPHFFSW